MSPQSPKPRFTLRTSRSLSYVICVVSSAYTRLSVQKGALVKRGLLRQYLWRRLDPREAYQKHRVRSTASQPFPRPRDSDTDSPLKQKEIGCHAIPARDLASAPRGADTSQTQTPSSNAHPAATAFRPGLRVNPNMAQTELSPKLFNSHPHTHVHGVHRMLCRNCGSGTYSPHYKQASMSAKSRANGTDSQFQSQGASWSCSTLCCLFMALCFLPQPEL